MKFLVVDDSAIMRRIMVNCLGRLGYKDAVEAANGAEALEICRDGVDCVLTDWNMPVMNGLDFVRALRALPGGSDVPVVMVTSRTIKDDILAAVALGVTGYLVKPFRITTLKEKVDAMVGHKAA